MYSDSPASVRAALAEHLAVAPGGRWTVEAPSRALRQPWSMLYFLPAISPAGERVRWVVKCPRAPDGESHLPGRDIRSLGARNRAEFSSLGAIRDHFARQHDPRLAAIDVVTYLPGVEGFVMGRFDGQPLFDGCLRVLHQLRPRRRKLANEGVRRAGAWLRWLHQMPLEHLNEPVRHSPQDAAAAIRREIGALVAGGVSEDTLPLGLLEAIADEARDSRRVATHSDYHLRNVVLLDDGRVLGFDTALNRVDSPCCDIGRFLADLRTRRSRILTGARLPTERRARRLEAAFLDGYSDLRLDRRTIALYEAQSMLWKWREDRAAVRSAFKRWPVLARIAHRLVIDPAFRRVMRQWVRCLGEPGPTRQRRDAAVRGDRSPGRWLTAD